MKKIKIGMFIDSFYPDIDGVITTVDNTAKGLLKYADVVVVVPNGNDILNHPYKVIKVKSINIKKLNYNVGIPSFDKKVYDKLKKEKFDIIHIHSPFLIGFLGLKLAKEENIPCVSSMHSQFKKDFKRYLKSDKLADICTKKIIKLFNESDEAWAVNKKVASLYKTYGYKNNPIVMNNATDLKPIINKEKTIEKLRKKYNLKDEKVFLYVGRMTILKNILFIADVLNILKEKNFNFKMFFIGNDGDIDLLKERITKYNLNDKVVFLGKIEGREKLSAFYCLADLFVFPSLYDASSLVQIEAASQKTPSIFIEGSVTSDTVTNNKNGYICKNNINAFAKKIIDIFENEKQYKKVCENAYNDLYVHFDDRIKIIYERYLNLINKK